MKQQEEELHDAYLHAAATIVVAPAYGCEFADCRLNDDGYKWPTSVAKRHGRGHHLIHLDWEDSGTPELLDDPRVWKAIEALAQFIRDNHGAVGTASPGGDSPALKLIKSMDLPTLTYA